VEWLSPCFHPDSTLSNGITEYNPKIDFSKSVKRRGILWKYHHRVIPHPLKQEQRDSGYGNREEGIDDGEQHPQKKHLKKRVLSGDDLCEKRHKFVHPFNRIRN